MMITGDAGAHGCAGRGMLTRRRLLAALVVVVVTLVGYVAWRTVADDDPAPSSTAATGPGQESPGSTGGDDSGAPPSTPDAPPLSGERATGPGTCAFLSTDDVSRAAGGAMPVELRQTVATSGGPGCEWVVGASQAPLQVEFDLGADPASTVVAEGEAVDGPWITATWSAATRTLHVDEGGGQAFVVRTADEDRDRSRAIAVEVALLVAARN